MKKKGKGKPRGMNYADVLKARRDRLQLAMDEAALLNVERIFVIMGNSRLIRRKNMNAKRAAKLMQIAHYYGEEKQVCKLMEELGEATSAASEVLMLLSYHEQGGKKRDLTARLEHLAGELADVVNVTEQIIQLFGLETDFKVARHEGIHKTLRRIREEQDDEV